MTSQQQLYHILLRSERQRVWRARVIKDIKIRRFNNFRKNIGRSYELYTKWGFER